MYSCGSDLQPIGGVLARPFHPGGNDVSSRAETQARFNITSVDTDRKTRAIANQRKEIAPPALINNE